MEVETIPEDLRHLRDFPTFDSTFQDKPTFRQNLSHWALKTDKVRPVVLETKLIRVKN